MLNKVCLLLCLVIFVHVECFNIHRVSKMRMKLEKASSDSPFNVASVDRYDFANPKKDKYGNLLPAFGEKFNLKFSALDSDLDVDLEVVKDVLTEDAVIWIPKSKENRKAESYPVVNNLYSKTYTDTEGNEFNIYLNVFSSTAVSGYVTKNGVDYKFTPLLNIRNEIKSMSEQFKNSAYLEQLAELDSIFGPESDSDSEEMVLVDLSDLPNDPLHQYQSDPSHVRLNSTDHSSDLKEDDIIEDSDAPVMDFQTDASSSQRAPLTLSQWPKTCHSFMNSDGMGQNRRYGVVDVVLDYSGYSYYNSFINHPHLGVNDQTRIQLISATLMALIAKTNYYFSQQVAFTHRIKHIVMFHKPSMITWLSPSALPYGTQMLCRSSAASNGPLCQVPSSTYFSNLIALRPLYTDLAQNTPFTRSTTLIAFTGLYASTADAHATPNSYAKSSIQYASVSLIPIFAPKPYNTLAKMLGIQMGAKATNDPTGICHTKGTNYMSGLMGNPDGVIKTGLNAGEVGFDKDCNLTEMCSYMSNMLTSSSTTSGVIHNANYHYVNPHNVCGNFREERYEYCEKMLDPVCCDSTCRPNVGSRCWSGDPQCCVGCQPQLNSKVCYTHDGMTGVCGKGGYCRPSHCADYNPDFVPCTNVGNPCEEMCKHKDAADSTCIALPTDVRNGDECKLSSTMTGVCLNKVCQPRVFEWLTSSTDGKYCFNNNLYEFVYCGDQAGNKVDENMCDWEGDIPHGWLGTCTPPTNTHTPGHDW